MFCENCGKQLPDTAAFCTGCGFKANTVPSPPAIEQPVMSAVSVSASSPAGSTAPVFQAPVPPVSRPVPTPQQHSQPVQAAAPAMPAQPTQPYGAAPGATRPAQSYGAAPCGARPGVRQPVFGGGETMGYGQYLVMLLLTCIPIVNIVLLFKWSFFGVANANKRNFAKAMLTIMVVAFLLSIVMGIATASMFR